MKITREKLVELRCETIRLYAVVENTQQTAVAAQQDYQDAAKLYEDAWKQFDDEIQREARETVSTASLSRSPFQPYIL